MTSEDLKALAETGFGGEPQFTIKDSGQRQDFSTGARRDVQTGKGRFDLLPWSVLWRDARHYEKGAAKYGDRNWEKGIPASRYFSAAIRHTIQLARGQMDEDHGAAARFNLAGLMDLQERIASGELPRELWDLPVPSGSDLYRHFQGIKESK